MSSSIMCGRPACQPHFTQSPNHLLDYLPATNNAALPFAGGRTSARLCRPKATMAPERASVQANLATSLYDRQTAS